MEKSGPGVLPLVGRACTYLAQVDSGQCGAVHRAVHRAVHTQHLSLEQQLTMGDSETVHSVRGKGWVKFEEEGDDVSTSTASTRRMSAAEDSPGSLEVPSYDSQLRFNRNT